MEYQKCTRTSPSNQYLAPAVRVYNRSIEAATRRSYFRRTALDLYGVAYCRDKERADSDFLTVRTQIVLEMLQDLLSQIRWASLEKAQISMTDA